MARGVLSGKSQRVAIMAFRDDRVHHRVLFLFHKLTRVMFADGLTKEGCLDQLLLRYATGKRKITLLENQAIRYQRANLHLEATEN